MILPPGIGRIASNFPRLHASDETTRASGLRGNHGALQSEARPLLIVDDDFLVSAQRARSQAGAINHTDSVLQIARPYTGPSAGKCLPRHFRQLLHAPRRTRGRYADARSKKRAENSVTRLASWTKIR